MPSWTKEELNAYEARRLSRSPKPEPDAGHEPLAKEGPAQVSAERIHVCITSYRLRLLDPDNLCVKYFVDCLRYAEIIPDDREQDISLHLHQVKVNCSSQQKTEIEVI